MSKEIERLLFTRAASYWYARDRFIWNRFWEVLNTHGIHPATPVTIPSDLEEEVSEAVAFIRAQEARIEEINKKLKRRKKR